MTNIIEQQVCNLLDSGDIIFPPCIKNTLSIRKYLTDPDISLTTIASSLALDPIISSHILSAINSPYYGYRVSNLHIAVSLLGASALNFITFSIIQKQLAANVTAETRKILEQFWLYNLEVTGASCAVATTETTKEITEEVMVLSMLLNLETMFIIFAVDKIGFDCCKSLENALMIRRLASQYRTTILRAFLVSSEVEESINFVYRNFPDDSNNFSTAKDVLLFGRFCVGVPQSLENFISILPYYANLTDKHLAIKSHILESFR